MEKKQLNIVIKQGARNVSYSVKKGFQFTFCFLGDAAL